MKFPRRDGPPACNTLNYRFYAVSSKTKTGCRAIFDGVNASVGFNYRPTEKTVRPPRFEQMRDGLAHFVRERATLVLKPVRLDLSVVALLRQNKSALPDLNGGQVDLQSTALPV